MDYGKTLNLLQTEFPMRGNLPQAEPKMQAWWKEIDIYRKVQEHRKGGPKFILHDGPPYANGDIHIGHALNKVLKDIIVRYKSMQGYDAPYVPGWDTHGLPIEQAIANSGKARVLGVTSLTRLSGYPSIPTVAESGVPGFEASVWYGLVAPRGTPDEAVRILHAALVRILGQPEVKKQIMTAVGGEVVANAPRDFGALIVSDAAKWGKVIQRAGVKVSAE